MIGSWSPRIGYLKTESGLSCYRWDGGIFGDDNHGQILQVDEFGPFESSKSLLRHHAKRYGDLTNHSPLSMGSRSLFDMLISYIPLSTERPFRNRETFVLSFPDFDSQNVMVDEQRILTGIIEWDNARTVPRFLGFLVSRVDYEGLGLDYVLLPCRQRKREFTEELSDIAKDTVVGRKNYCMEKEIRDLWTNLISSKPFP